MGILPELSEKITADTTIKTYKDSLIGKQTFKFDFEKNEFVTDVMGNAIMTNNPNELLEQVVNKILHDRRYKNLIYPDSYGNEVDLILNQDDPYEVVECELRRVFTEALVYHPLIASLSNFEITGEGDMIFCEFVVNGIDGTYSRHREVVRYVETTQL